MLSTILTTADVIDSLGGNLAAAKLLGVKYNNITNWRTFGSFPPDTYIMIQEELKLRGLVAPDHLFRMRKRGRLRPRKKKARTAA
jgi:hypothetical protein